MCKKKKEVSDDARKISVVDTWLNKFPCKKYWKYPDAGCIHEHITAEEMYEYIQKKIRGEKV